MKQTSNLWILGAMIFTAVACKSAHDQSAIQSALFEPTKGAASTKQAALWAQVSAEPYRKLPELSGILNLLRHSADIKDPAKNSRSFVQATDVIPDQRQKSIHKYGAVAIIDFIPDVSAEHPYPGVLATKASVLGLIRFSLAGKPELFPIHIASYTPGIALKILIDGENNPSLNVMVMHSLDGQKLFNFFENSMSNVLPPGKSLVVRTGAPRFEAGLKLQGLRPTANILAVDHLAGQNPDGSSVEASEVRPAKRLVFEPDPTVKSLMAQALKASPRADFRTLLIQNISEGTTIYEVFASDSESLADPDRPVHIGSIRTSSPVVASDFGDSMLHFQHYQSKSGEHSQD